MIALKPGVTAQTFPREPGDFCVMGAVVGVR